MNYDWLPGPHYFPEHPEMKKEFAGYAYRADGTVSGWWSYEPKFSPMPEFKLLFSFEEF